jgi:molecular chaperone HscB
MRCAACGAPLGAELDCFATLGLPRRLMIDRAALERTYHELGHRMHPDRFATATPPVRDASLRGTARLTRAYRTLSDPVSRGLYWLELNGRKLAENNKEVPRALAETVFAVQEQLDDLRTVRSVSRSGEPDAAQMEAEMRVEVEQRRGELRVAMDAAERELEANFARWDVVTARDEAEAGGAYSEGEAERDARFGELKSILSKIAYLRTLIRDIDRELETAQAA